MKTTTQRRMDRADLIVSTTAAFCALVTLAILILENAQ